MRQEVLSLGWSAADFLASGSMDGDVRLWHPSRPGCLRVFQCGPGNFPMPCLLPPGIAALRRTWTALALIAATSQLSGTSVDCRAHAGLLS